MTKQTEINLLDEFIAKLGKDSYLGPALALNRDVIVKNIKNDHPPFTGILRDNVFPYAIV